MVFLREILEQLMESISNCPFRKSLLWFILATFTNASLDLCWNWSSEYLERHGVLLSWLKHISWDIVSADKHFPRLLYTWQRLSSTIVVCEQLLQSQAVVCAILSIQEIALVISKKLLSDKISIKIISCGSPFDQFAASYLFQLCFPICKTLHLWLHQSMSTSCVRYLYKLALNEYSGSCLCLAVWLFTALVREFKTSYGLLKTWSIFNSEWYS